ncbi:MAG TPA: FTR1 family protein [Candidatus Dormibacteraeota bacterium]|nr:FTR1 family protein [Candidatus Dormibacteraeota bacterium]
MSVIGSLLIFAREGIEGTLICSILLTYLASAGRRDLFRFVFLGAGSAVGLAVAAGIVLWIASRDAFINSTAQAWFETAVFAIAVAVLTYMTFWMRRHSRSMGKELRAKVSGVVRGGSGLALALVAFVTVGREAIETVIFLLAIAYQSSPLQLAIGAVIGLVIAFGLSIAMYRVGLRLNLRRFFAIVGSLLMVVAAGLLADAVQNLQGLGVLPGGSMTLWNMSRTLPDDTGIGDVLHGLVGYSAAPTVLQAILWAGFLAVGLTLFLRPAQTPVSRPPSAPAAAV